VRLTFTDTYCHANFNAASQPDSDSNLYSHPNANRYLVLDTDCDRDCNSDCYSNRDGDRNCNANSYSTSYTDSETYTRSAASSYPGTAPITIYEKETHCSIRSP